jgi:hypothetical protein
MKFSFRRHTTENLIFKKSLHCQEKPIFDRKSKSNVYFKFIENITKTAEL